MNKTKTLIELLGREELTLYELGALIIVAGRDAGFDVCTERAQKIPSRLCLNGRARKGALDCTWLTRGKDPRIAVAWEIDGRDVKTGHLKPSIKTIGNGAKFKASNASVKIQALYSIRGQALPALNFASTFFQKTSVRVLSDTELIRGELLLIVASLRKINARAKLANINKNKPFDPRPHLTPAEIQEAQGVRLGH